MHKIWTAAVIGLAFAPVAFAQEGGNREGLYLGGGIGRFSTQIDELDDVVDALPDFDEDESSAKYFVGWRFNRFLAVQADYYDFGDSAATLNQLAISAETQGIGPSIIGTLPVWFIELFARAGIVYYDLELNLDVDNLIDESGNDPVYSAGIGLTLFQRLNLQLEYEVIDIEELDEAEAVWLNFSWRF